MCAAECVGSPDVRLRMSPRGVISNQDQLCCVGAFAPGPGGQAGRCPSGLPYRGPTELGQLGGAVPPLRGGVLVPHGGGEDHSGGVSSQRGSRPFSPWLWCPWCGRCCLVTLRPALPATSWELEVCVLLRGKCPASKWLFCRETQAFGGEAAWNAGHWEPGVQEGEGGPASLSCPGGSGCRAGARDVPVGALLPPTGPGSGCCSWQECPLPRATGHPHLRLGNGCGACWGLCPPQASCSPWSRSCQWAPQGAWCVPVWQGPGRQSVFWRRRRVLGALALGGGLAVCDEGRAQLADPAPGVQPPGWLSHLGCADGPVLCSGQGDCPRDSTLVAKTRGVGLVILFRIPQRAGVGQRWAPLQAPGGQWGSGPRKADGGVFRWRLPGTARSGVTVPEPGELVSWDFGGGSVVLISAPPANSPHAASASSSGRALSLWAAVCLL